MKIQIPYQPRPQLDFIHADPSRFRVVVAHRRAGKTVACINELIRQALTINLPDVRCFYIGPTYRQTKAVAWDYLKYYSKAIPGLKVNESELKIDFPNGARVSLLGAESFDTIRGIYCDFIICDEVSQMNPRVWTEVLRPALTPRGGGEGGLSGDPKNLPNGGRAVFIGTPQGKNFFYELYIRAKKEENWSAFTLSAATSMIIPPMELEAMKRDMSPAEYAQEMLCSFDSGLQHAFYGDLMTKAHLDGRITQVPHDPSYPVFTAWDIGFRDFTAIVFLQPIKGAINIVDYYEANQMDIPHYVDVMRKKPYVFEDAILPHDCFHQRIEAAGKSVAQQLASFGLRIRPAPKPAQVSQYQGINAVRSILPRCYFDKVKAFRLVECLENYKIDFNEKLGVNRQGAIHDWASHGADAFRMAAISLPANAGRYDIETRSSVRAFNARQTSDPLLTYSSSLSGDATPLEWHSSL